MYHPAMVDALCNAPNTQCREIHESLKHMQLHHPQHQVSSAYRPELCLDCDFYICMPDRFYNEHSLMLFQNTQPQVMSTAWNPEPNTISNRI